MWDGCVTWRAEGRSSPAGSVKLSFLPLNSIILLRQTGFSGLSAILTSSGVRVGTKDRCPCNFGYNSDFTAVFNVIFKTSIWNFSAFYIKSNALDWTGTSDPTFVQKKKKEMHRSEAFPGLQMIKKGKTLYNTS